MNCHCATPSHPPPTPTIGVPPNEWAESSIALVTTSLLNSALLLGALFFISRLSREYNDLWRFAQTGSPPPCYPQPQDNHSHQHDDPLPDNTQNSPENPNPPPSAPTRGHGTLGWQLRQLFHAALHAAVPILCAPHLGCPARHLRLVYSLSAIVGLIPALFWVVVEDWGLLLRAGGPNGARPLNSRLRELVLPAHHVGADGPGRPEEEEVRPEEEEEWWLPPRMRRQQRRREWREWVRQQRERRRLQQRREQEGAERRRRAEEEWWRLQQEEMQREQAEERRREEEEDERREEERRQQEEERREWCRREQRGQQRRRQRGPFKQQEQQRCRRRYQRQQK